jgi:hypothetical protein
MKRLSTARLIEEGAELAERERALLHTVDRFGLLTHAQLAALIDADQTASGARIARRVLKRLYDRGLLARLERRIGGVRAGSAGYVYYLGPAGQRLISFWRGHGLTRGRFRPEPGSRYVSHRLAVSELYVQAIQAGRQGLLDLLAFDPEPGCWRSFGDGFGGTRTLKPDAFVQVGVGAYEDRYFIEVDLASESLRVIGAKLRAYVDYFNSGEEQRLHDVFPRVLLLTKTEERRAAIVDSCSRLPAEAWRLFTVQTLDVGVAVLSGQLADQTAQEAEALS